MNSKKFFLTGLSGLSILALFRSAYEVRSLKATSYKIKSAKLSEGSKYKIVFITDLHGRTYGPSNSKFLRLIKEQRPDYILIGGDLITAGKKAEDSGTIKLLSELKSIAPVYYAMGNHEEYLRTERYKFAGRFDVLKKALEKENIPLLNNRHVDLENNISVYGLEISRKYYRRFNKKKPKAKDMNSYLGKPDKNRYNILLAHTPAFFDVYESWGPDLVLCGHYHGGIIGIPDFKNKERRKGLISPGFKILPDYCAGKFKKNDTDLIVSAGCGSHSINIRLFNKPEVVIIELSSEA